MILLVVMGAINQSKYMLMMSLAVVGTLTNQILWVYGGLHGGLHRPIWVYAEVYTGLHGSTQRSMWVYMEVYMGLCGGLCGSMWVYAEVYMGLHKGLHGGLCRSTRRSTRRSTQVYVGLCGSMQVYAEVYTDLCGGPWLFVLGYHWLPLATIDLVDDNREFDRLGIFWGFIPIIIGWWS